MDDGWFKSSYSSAVGNCVEVKFEKSSYSGANSYVEVAIVQADEEETND